ncbi:MAG TPA: hypothetical protein VLG37_01365 [Candidatus Saccharimonadales bacterium]|nr:hypothetical protein [Candidatus Saccharimonadales bacterium]
MSERYKPTRRLKILAGALGAATGVAVGIAGYKALGHSQEFAHKVPAAGEDYRNYKVEPGDTPWSLAKLAYPGEDPRRVVSMIEAQEPEGSEGNLTQLKSVHFPLDAHLGVVVHSMPPAEVKK